MRPLSEHAILWLGMAAVLAVLLAGGYFMLGAQFH
jgi:hypothetical protein